jgi:hypothetical protein
MNQTKMTDGVYCCDRMGTAVENDLIQSGATVDDSFFGGQVNEYPINYCPFCGKPLEQDDQKE